MRAHHFLVQALHEARPGRRHPLRGGSGLPQPADAPTGCGSSTRSTAPTSSARPAGRTGPCTSPSSSRAPRSPPPSPCPRSAARSRTRPPPVVPPPDGRRAAHRHQPLPLAAGRRDRGPGARSRRRSALGSAGAKAMAVVMGHADVYAHHGGMYEWDSAAPAAVAAAAGLHVSRIDGSPLVYNNPDPWLPDLLVCRPELAEPVLERAVELKATRFEVDRPAWPRSGCTGRTATTPGRAGCTPSTAGSSPSWRPTVDGAGGGRHRHAARVLRRRRQRRAGRPRRAGRLRPGLPAEPAQPGLRRAARAGPRLRLALRAAPARDRRGQRRLRRRRPRPRPVLRPALRQRHRQAHHGRAQARACRPSTG